MRLQLIDFCPQKNFHRYMYQHLLQQSFLSRPSVDFLPLVMIPRSRNAACTSANSIIRGVANNWRVRGRGLNRMEENGSSSSSLPPATAISFKLQKSLAHSSFHGQEKDEEMRDFLVSVEANELHR